MLTLSFGNVAWNGSTEAVKGSDGVVGVVSEGRGLANGSDLKGLPYRKTGMKCFNMNV